MKFDSIAQMKTSEIEQRISSTNNEEFKAALEAELKARGTHAKVMDGRIHTPNVVVMDEEVSEEPVESTSAKPKRNTRKTTNKASESSDEG